MVTLRLDGHTSTKTIWLWSLDKSEIVTPCFLRDCTIIVRGGVREMRKEWEKVSYVSPLQTQILVIIPLP